MFVHKVLFEFLEFKHPRLLLVSPSGTSTGGGLLGVKFLASENWCGRVHFGGHSPEWRVLAKFSVQPCVPCFFRVIETLLEVWENEKCCAARVSTAFSSSPKLS